MGYNEDKYEIGGEPYEKENCYIYDLSSSSSCAGVCRNN
jgi:hypothetical protein